MSGFRFKSIWNYHQFAYRVQRNFRFIRAKEDEEFLREVLKASTDWVKTIPEGSMFWRAQRGHKSASYWEEDGEPVYMPPEPHSRERMKPQTNKAREGRANARGIPVLYLATNKDTAMSEVRPWLGLYVSCAQFKINRPLKIVDLSDHSGRDVFVHMVEPEDDDRQKAVWGFIGEAFSVPTTRSDDVDEYAPTQLIAELFKSAGYDGIAYKSMISKKGHNVAIFNPEDADMVFCDLYSVHSVNFTFSDNHRRYWVDDTGRYVSMRVEDVSPPQPKDENES